MRDVLVIGAGWAGLTAAARLAAKGHEVTVVEKARGPGGRSATRREGDFSFDHGAQYLTARNEAFARQVEAWAAAGLLARWEPKIAVFGEAPEPSQRTTQRWVGVPSMNAVPKRLAEGLDCRWQWRVTELERDTDGWTAISSEGERIQARSLLLTAPPAQCRDLLGRDHPLDPVLSAVDMQPCWALMLGYDHAPKVDFEAAFVNRGPLAWLARIDSRPGRSCAPAWIAHAAPDWSERYLESESEQAVATLLEALADLHAPLAERIAHAAAHRWRYARGGIAGLSPPLLGDGASKLVVAGDWCAGERVEGAWISGVSAARRLEALL